MNKQTFQKYEQWIENQNRIKAIFPQQYAIMHFSCAGIYFLNGKEVNELVLEEIKEVAISNRNFSKFSVDCTPLLIAMLAVSGSSKRIFESGLQIYEFLKKELGPRYYLPVMAMMIAQLADPFQYEKVSSRIFFIYNKMEEMHPSLVPKVDNSISTLMALSEKTDSELIEDIEQCFRLLISKFSSFSSAYRLSQVLSLYDGKPKEKCEKTMDLFYKIKDAGYKYGTGIELPALGVFAMGNNNQDEVVREIVETDKWLKRHNEFGICGSISSKLRLMYAGRLTQRDFINKDIMHLTLVSIANVLTGLERL